MFFAKIILYVLIGNFNCFEKYIQLLYIKILFQNNAKDI